MKLVYCGHSLDTCAALSRHLRTRSQKSTVQIFRSSSLPKEPLRRQNKEFVLDNRFVLLSGCSGGGKSTLLVELKARGHAIVEEPGRRIVNQELLTGGDALPWVDLSAFLRRAIEIAVADLKAASDHDGWVFFDRGLIDAASALEALSGEAVLHSFCAEMRYYPKVFMAPPWPEIYLTDKERRHDFEASLAEYTRLERVFPILGYEVVTLPKTTASARADFILTVLGSKPNQHL